MRGDRLLVIFKEIHVEIWAGKYKNKNQELESEYSKKEISYLEQKD